MDNDLAALRAENLRLREALEAVKAAAQYDACMEGPAFKGWNRSALDRALPKVIAALAKHEPTQAARDAVREALDAAKKAEDAMREMFRYFDGGETRGSYDGKPERAGLRNAWYGLRSALATLAKHGGAEG